MDSRLSKLVLDYQAKVAVAVSMLEAAGIPRPSSNIEWATRAWEAEAGSARGSLPAGFTYSVHGFGCAVDGPDWGVDFDFGNEGEIDGFDASRLHDFARKRLSQYEFASEKEIDNAIRAAADAGELRFSGYMLYYLVR